MTKAAKLALITLAMTAAFNASAAQSAPKSWRHITCGSCAEWNVRQKPFKVYGNTWYVGTRELSALLITSPHGHVLLDGALPQSAPLIAANVKALGFRMKDVKLILNSHEHFDHAGGIMQLQRASGAQVAASAIGAKVLQAGAINAEDPQFDPTEGAQIEPVPSVKVVGDEEVLKAGDIAVTAHMTPGHAPGGTTWSWTSCEKGKCLNVVYADSLTMVSTDGYRFSDHPERISAFKSSVDKIASLKCDIIISTHPGFTDTMEKQASMTASVNPFIEADGCRVYAAEGAERMTKRLAKEAPAVKK